MSYDYLDILEEKVRFFRRYIINKYLRKKLIIWIYNFFFILKNWKRILYIKFFIKENISFEISENF